MKTYQQLKEDFYAYMRSPVGKGNFPLFYNPTGKEIEELVKLNEYDSTVRLLVKTEPSIITGDLIAWPADKAIHMDVADHLGERLDTVIELEDINDNTVLPLTYDYDTEILYFSDLIPDEFEMDTIADDLTHNQFLNNALYKYEIVGERLFAKV